MTLIEIPEEIERERQFALEDRDFHAQLLREKQTHEEALARLKLVEQGNVKVRLSRGAATQRILIALVKLLPIVVLTIAIPVLLLAKREVPQFLQEFLSL